jgi:hypothetical protein
MHNLKNLSFFLHCGFLPVYNKGAIKQIINDNVLDELPHLRRKNNMDVTSIINQGRRAFEASFKNISDNLNIVPLSGGLDSRYILAELLNLGIKDKIITVSYGIPGTYDFEIGKEISKREGLQHEIIDTSNIEVNLDQLINVARNGRSWTLLIDAFYHSMICKMFGDKATYWSGFMGGELAGSHLPVVESDSWITAKRHFLKWNKFVRSLDLSMPDHDLIKSLPSSPLIDKSILSYDDQLDFGYRQYNWIKNVVLVKGYNYRVPYLSSEWQRFILSIPRQYRINKFIFKKILEKTHPRFFLYPTTNYWGGSLKSSTATINTRIILNSIRRKIENIPHISTSIFDPAWRLIKIFKDVNYIDFNEAIRSRKDFNSLVYSQTQDLKKRKILEWIDIDSIWEDHHEKIINHGSALMLLTALEINIKAST